MRFRRPFLLTCLAVLGIACSEPLAIWVLPNSTIDNLRFGVSHWLHDTTAVVVRSLLVGECYVADTLSDRWYWEIGPRMLNRGTKRNVITYGRTPRGLRSRVEPRPLKRNACYYVYLSASRGAAYLTFVTDSLGGVQETPPGELESLKWLGSAPYSVADSSRLRLAAHPMDSLVARARDVLHRHGFAIATSDTSAVVTETLKLGGNWEQQRVAERIDCGRGVGGWNAVNLPLSRDSVNGYGHLLVTVQVRFTIQERGTLVAIDSDVLLNPPWFEQGRPMIRCALREEFVRLLLDEVT